MLILNINRKTYKECPTTSSHLTLSDLQRSNSRSLTFWSRIYHKGAELGHMLLLNINRKAYMRSQITLLHLTRSDLERSRSRSLKFRKFLSRKGTELDHYWKLRCRIWSKIDTCIVRYCVRVNLDFNWFSLQQWVFDSLQKIDNVIPTAAVKHSAKVLGPLVSVTKHLSVSMVLL